MRSPVAPGVLCGLRADCSTGAGSGEMTSAQLEAFHIFFLILFNSEHVCQSWQPLLRPVISWLFLGGGVEATLLRERFLRLVSLRLLAEEAMACAPRRQRGESGEGGRLGCGERRGCFLAFRQGPLPWRGPCICMKIYIYIKCRSVNYAHCY